jgi:hypothetical protein
MLYALKPSDAGKGYALMQGSAEHFVMPITQYVLTRGTPLHAFLHLCLQNMSEHELCDVTHAPFQSGHAADNADKASQFKWEQTWGACQEWYPACSLGEKVHPLQPLPIKQEHQ